MNNPEWTQKVVDLYQDSVAHTYILSGNVRDYIVPGLRLRNFVSKWMGQRVVVFYDRSAGITFASQASELAFRKVLKLDGENAEPENPALAALRQSRGQASEGLPELPVNPDQALPLIEKFMRQAQPQTAVIVIDFIETIVPAADPAFMSPADRTSLVTVARWGADQELESQGQLIFLVTAEVGQVNDALKASTSRIEQIDLPWPGLDVRLDFIETQLAGFGGKAEVSPRQLAGLTAGLTLLGIEDIFLRAERLGRLDIEDVKRRKSELIAAEYGEVLEVMNPKGGFETVGGLEFVKAYFEKRVIRPIRDGRLQAVPMGTLMMGPAGTGKSIMAEAVANECGFNAVKLNIGGQIASKWQGEGERKLRKALQGILTFAPTIVFIDEIDQAVKRDTGGSNQQDARIFQLLLEFMADTSHRGKVIFMAATNRPDNMDAALLRPGRLDDKIAFLVPGNNDERESIFKVMARKVGLDIQAIPVDVLNGTAGYTGAEIEKITIKAFNLLADGDAGCPEEALTMAARKIRQSTRAIEQMTRIALAMLDDEDYVPVEYRQFVGIDASEELPTEIEPAIRKRREI